jgi:hypothetical protein
MDWYQKIKCIDSIIYKVNCKYDSLLIIKKTKTHPKYKEVINNCNDDLHKLKNNLRDLNKKIENNMIKICNLEKGDKYKYKHKKRFEVNYKIDEYMSRYNKSKILLRRIIYLAKK